MTNDQADFLIGMKKRILDGNRPAKMIEIQQFFPFNHRFELVPDESDEDFMFVWEISQSTKNSLRISLHYQEDESKIGLLRVDYNSGHRNPEFASDDLPEKFKPYIGYWFENESHVHYHVEGYKSLVWALPISKSGFEVKEIAEPDFNLQFMSAIKSFAKYINIETEIIIAPLLI